MIDPAYWQLELKTTRSAPGEPAVESQLLFHFPNNTLCNRELTTSVDSTRPDRELLPRAADAEVEAFVVVVAVRVVVAADLLSVLEVVATLVDGGGDLGC